MVNISKAQLVIVDNKKSVYKIVIPLEPNSGDKKAAEILNQYINEISGASLEIHDDASAEEKREICIGKTNRKNFNDFLSSDGFLIRTNGSKIFIQGGNGKGLIYGVYHFLEQYLKCRKFSALVKYVPLKNTITIPLIDVVENPVLKFRQVYYKDQYDPEYLDWHKLQLLEDHWGLWGHTFDKLVSPSLYFEKHPEYFALVNGQRKPTQLCLSNKAVFEIAVKTISEKIKSDPLKRIWSVGQNDGLGYCTCDKCAAIDMKFGGPQGSIINFVNKVAQKFPDKTISTLAYLYSKHPPVGIKPAANVSIMLSTIDLERSVPIQINQRSAGFRNDFKGWLALTGNVMIWDYVVQFTNYLSPFPNLATLQDNMNYFGAGKINGIFAQGSESTLGEFSELKTYLLAKLAWKPTMDVAAVKLDFMNSYYGKAAPYLMLYQNELEKQSLKSKRMLDIYGDPVAEWNTWLTPELIVSYDGFLDKAEAAVSSMPQIALRVEKERLALEYAVLQQARFYGIEKHGAFVRSANSWQVKPGFDIKVSRFLESAKRAGIKELAEGGPDLNAYASEWSKILKDGPLLHKALNKPVRIVIPNNADYPAKGARTLTDGSMGYNNFQYNYLGWYGDNMEVVIDLVSPQTISQVTAGFLEDQRHWSFLPEQVEVLISLDDKSYVSAGVVTTPKLFENYEKETRRIEIPINGKVARYVKLKAVNLKKLPEWRDLPNRKSWIFCDEVSVF
ncbi:MAG: DUF4838 domain-containing protein [Bacteroidota bacterium]